MDPKYNIGILLDCGDDNYHSFRLGDVEFSLNSKGFSVVETGELEKMRRQLMLVKDTAQALRGSRATKLIGLQLDEDLAGKPHDFSRPCPHPERAGRHEVYSIDRDLVCRACGATIPLDGRR